jgi:hypothetical protein
LELLRALLDRLIPADDFAGAVAAGVDDYVLRMLAGDLAPRLPAVSAGLRDLDSAAAARHGREFAALSASEQDLLLQDMGSGSAFFNLMVTLAAEGYYADPGNGGNRDRVSWKMVGYDPRVGEP